jgi:hypothetical protein
MPRLAFRHCKNCDRPTSETGPLSWTRLCIDCAIELHIANTDQLRAKEGEYFEHWARRSYMAARKTLLDAERQSA